MTKIGLISDTHGFIDNRIFDFFKDCNEIWHAGDIGNLQTADKLANFKTLRAVYGNIDGTEVRAVYKQNARFNCENMDVWITHIGGYPGRYDPRVRKQLLKNPPDIFIAGHSHTLKIIHDPKIDCLHINPGAAGNHGFHKVKTAIRFEIDNKNIKNLEILEMKRK